MKRFSHIKYAAVLLAAMSLASCQDDETIKDEQLPQVNISTQGLEKKVWADLKLTADAKDNDQVSRVEFYVDGTLVQTINTAPYEISLDTKKYEDGEHMVKVIAYDQNMNQMVAEKKIDVFNKLMKFIVEENYLVESESSKKEEFIVLTDKAGRVIDSKEIVNGSELVFERPKTFVDSSFYVTVATRETRDPERDVNVFIDTYQNITPDIWTFRGKVKDDGQMMTYQAKLNITSPTGVGVSVEISKGDAENKGYVSGDSIRYESNLYMYSIPQNVLVTAYDHDGKMPPMYKYMTGIEDETYHLQYEDLKPMNKLNDITIPNGNSASIYMTGYTNPDNFEEENYSTSSAYADGEKNVLSVYFPTEVFKHYRYHLFSNNGEGRHLTRSSAQPLQNSYDIPDLGVQINNSALSEFSGSIGTVKDFTLVSGYYSDYETNKNIRLGWYVMGSSTDKTINLKLTETATVIGKKYSNFQKHINNLKYGSIALYDYENIDSYEEYINIAMKKAGNYYERFPGYERVSQNNMEDNARIAKDSQRLEEEKLMGDPFSRRRHK